MILNNLEVKHLADNDISLGIYTYHQVTILGKCALYMIHSNTKKSHAVIFYVASNEGSVLQSCITLLALDFIQTRPPFHYLPPLAKLIISVANHANITEKISQQG